MTFHGQSVFSLVWGVVTPESPRDSGSPLSWFRSRFLRRPAAGPQRAVAGTSVATKQASSARKQRKSRDNGSLAVTQLFRAAIKFLRHLDDF